jgi:hypothetical protein
MKRRHDDDESDDSTFCTNVARGALFLRWHHLRRVRDLLFQTVPLEPQQSSDFAWQIMCVRFASFAPGKESLSLDDPSLFLSAVLFDAPPLLPEAVGQLLKHPNALRVIDQSRLVDTIDALVQQKAFQVASKLVARISEGRVDVLDASQDDAGTDIREGIAWRLSCAFVTLCGMQTRGIGGLIRTFVDCEALNVFARSSVLTSALTSALCNNVHETLEVLWADTRVVLTSGAIAFAIKTALSRGHVRALQACLQSSRFLTSPSLNTWILSLFFEMREQDFEPQALDAVLCLFAENDARCTPTLEMFEMACLKNNARVVQAFVGHEQLALGHANADTAWKILSSAIMRGAVNVVRTLLASDHFPDSMSQQVRNVLTWQPVLSACSLSTEETQSEMLALLLADRRFSRAQLFTYSPLNRVANQGHEAAVRMLLASETYAQRSEIDAVIDAMRANEHEFESKPRCRAVLEILVSALR